LRLIALILMVLLGALQYRLWVGDGSLADLHRLDQSIGRQQHENAELRARNARLEADVVDLKTGLEAVEERARSELGMIRKGETFYQIVGRDGGKD